MLSPEQEARKQKLIEELAELLWEEAEAEKPRTLEDIERILRCQGQEHIQPGLMSFFRAEGSRPKQKTPPDNDKQEQADKDKQEQDESAADHPDGAGEVESESGTSPTAEVRPHTQNSPLLERCLLVCTAKSSFRQAEKDVALFLGLPVSDSTLRRLALSDQRPSTSSSEVSDPTPVVPYNRAAVDGGMVRLAEAESGTLWRQYKAIAAEDDQGRRRMEARLGDDEFLVRHFAPRMHPTAALLGDGHDGVWNLVARLQVSKGQEILDWYHLKENVYRAPLSDRSKQNVTDRLWEDEVNGALSLIGTHFKDRIPLRAYLEKHRSRMPHYRKRHEQQEVIGSGTVESATKQFDARLQVPGAYWLESSVNPMLRLRADYLNGYLHA